MSTVPLDQAPTAMIQRVATLLDVFADDRALTLAEVSRHSHVPRSTAHRILQDLVELGWVERHGYRYVLGMRMFELGNAVRQRRVPQAALPIMTTLHRRTGLTAYLSLLDRAKVLHVERVGQWPGSHFPWSVGCRQSVTQSAAGWALLSAVPQDLWPGLSFDDTTTVYGVHRLRDLHREIAKTVDRGGVAVDTQGYELGVNVVAAAIDVGDPSGRYALSLCCPSRILRMEPVVSLVRVAAADICYRALRVSAQRTSMVRSTHLTSAMTAVHRMLATAGAS